MLVEFGFIVSCIISRFGKIALAIKNSTRQKTLEIFVSKIYKEITNVVNMSVFKQIEYLRKIS